MVFELYHHGIRGQKWGVKNGPPYPLKGGRVEKTNHTNVTHKKRKRPNSVYNKRHYDETINADKETLTTLSWDPNRTKDTDMFFATHKALDKHQYNAMFNRPTPQTITDSEGNVVKEKPMLKYRIDNKISRDMKVASEDSAAKIFADLYEKDRDFYNFVNDEDRLASYFQKDRYKFRGYRESREVLNKMKNPQYTPTDKDLQTVYRMFNYSIPYDGGGKDNKGAKDMKAQRSKFFKEAEKQGYDAILDVNDAIYGGFKATSPVIVFNMESLIPQEVRRTNMRDKRISEAITAGRKIVGA